MSMLIRGRGPDLMPFSKTINRHSPMMSDPGMPPIPGPNPYGGGHPQRGPFPTGSPFGGGNILGGLLGRIFGGMNRPRSPFGGGFGQGRSPFNPFGSPMSLFGVQRAPSPFGMSPMGQMNPYGRQGIPFGMPGMQGMMPGMNPMQEMIKKMAMSRMRQRPRVSYGGGGGGRARKQNPAALNARAARSGADTLGGRVGSSATRFTGYKI